MRIHKMVLPLLLLCLIIFSCQHITDPNSKLFRLSTQNNVTANFIMQNRDGEPRSVFTFGDDVTFDYSLKNISDSALEYKIDGGPFVTFEIYSGDSLFGTSDDGLAWILVSQLRSLKPGDSLERVNNWLGNQGHVLLPVGGYSVLARPRFRFTNGDTVETIRQDLFIGCATRAGNCEEAPPVVLLDLPPEAIHADAFQINSASLAGDSLNMNLPYRGACNSHDFTLFASSFMESFPVQVNLNMRHLGYGDPCDAYPSEDLIFNLQPLRDSYVEFYGSTGQINLNLFEFFGENSRALRLEYKF